MDQGPHHEFYDDICGICHEGITDVQAKAEFLCFHAVHTQCIYRGIADMNVNVFMCTVCNNDLNRIDAVIGEGEGEQEQEQEPQQQEDVAQVEYGPQLPEEDTTRRRRRNSRQEVEEAFQTNAEFRADLKKLINATTDYNKNKTILARSIKETKLRYRAEVELLRNSLREIKQNLKRDIVDSQVFKDARNAYNRRSFYKSLIDRKYPYEFRKIRHVVGEKRGFRRLRTYHAIFYRTPGRMLYRAFYFRVHF